MLRGRIKFTPRDGAEAEIGGEGYNFSADTRFDRLFTGVVVETPSWAKGLTEVGGGMEHVWPEDTLDLDYGRLLDEALGRRRKGREMRGDPDGI